MTGPADIRPPGGSVPIEQARIDAPMRCSRRDSPLCVIIGGAILTLPASIDAGACCCCRGDHGDAIVTHPDAR